MSRSYAPAFWYDHEATELESEQNTPELVATPGKIDEWADCAAELGVPALLSSHPSALNLLKPRLVQSLSDKLKNRPSVDEVPTRILRNHEQDAESKLARRSLVTELEAELSKVLKARQQQQSTAKASHPPNDHPLRSAPKAIARSPQSESTSTQQAPLPARSSPLRAEASSLSTAAGTNVFALLGSQGDGTLPMSCNYAALQIRRVPYPTLTEQPLHDGSFLDARMHLA